MPSVDTVGTVPRPRASSAQLWIQRRYQDDFLNPTTATRWLKGGIPEADLQAGGSPFGGPWQAATGYSVRIADHMSNTSPLSANLFVRVYDEDLAQDRYFFNNVAEELTA